MKLRTGIWLGVGVAAVALISIPFLLPLDTYRAPIETAASRALGRQVRIKGPMHLAVYPQLGISLSDVTIANAEGARDPEMVNIGSVLVGAELMPLLSRRLEVTEVVLQKPVIHLEVTKDGTPNWRFTQGSANARGANGARPPATPAAPANASAQESQGFDFRTVSIDGGELSYFDASSNRTEAFHDIDIKATLQRGGNRAQPLAAPLKLDGNLTYNNETLKIDSKVDRFSALLNGQPTGLHLGISSNVINADFTGSIGNEGTVSGALKMGAHSVRSFAAWAGHPMPPGNGFGLLAMEGQFSTRDGVYTLSHTHLAFDSMSLNSDISIDVSADVPLIKGVITIDKLDVNPYLAPGTETDAVKAAKVKAAASPDAPIELGWLKAANAEVKLVLGGLILPNAKLEQAVVNVSLKDGVLKTELNNVNAYGGTGKGTLTLDATGATPVLHETLDVTGLKVQPFLNDTMGIERISGAGIVRVDMTARGATEAALLKSLNGKGSFKFTDGAISGVDLQAVAKLLQSVLTTEVLTGAVGGNAKTNFGQMTGSFVVQNGVLRTDDVALTSSAVEMSGKGTIDLSGRTLEFHMNPKAKNGIPGLKLVDIGVPFYVKGPWDHLGYGPDAGGLAKNLVNKLGEDATLPAKVLKDPAGTLRSLFGKDK